MATMGLIGCGAGLLAALFFIFGLIPFLGWINWITTLPLAAIAAAIAYNATKQHPADQAARITLAAAMILILVTLARLAIGGGFI